MDGRTAAPGTAGPFSVVVDRPAEAGGGGGASTAGRSARSIQQEGGGLLTWEAGDTRPLVWLDLGSGTGRMTPSLASAFGGPAHGVERHATCGGEGTVFEPLEALTSLLDELDLKRRS